MRAKSWKVLQCGQADVLFQIVFPIAAMFRFENHLLLDCQRPAWQAPPQSQSVTLFSRESRSFITPRIAKQAHTLFRETGRGMAIGCHHSCPFRLGI
jgi:hypothetical protein